MSQLTSQLTKAIPMTKISAVIVAHNEEQKIEDCLKSLHFVDEIVVVLDKCSDGTKEIVQQYSDKIIEGSWHLEGARRNVAVEAASHEWILEMDADERISKDLEKEIVELAEFSDPCCYIVPIANYVGDRYVKYGWMRTLGVLQRQTIHYKGYKKYHEDKEIHPTADLEGEVKMLEHPIIHLVDDNVTDLLNRFNRYTNWRAKDMIASGKKVSFLKMVVGSKIRFIKAFIAKKGYKEGGLGFLIAMLVALYPIVSYIKAKEMRSTHEDR